MHERNRYRRHPPDFAALAKKPPWFARHVVVSPRGKAHVDWSDPHATKAVTKVLLLNDFGVEWDIPGDRLCPPVANRLNYLHWIEDILSLGANPRQAVCGIDIGTGASCIYALLATSMHDDWSFLATELDQKSAEAAKANVERNPKLREPGGSQHRVGS